ncbi:MAG TPA: family 1 encapsulin nanocompartment shell protein, partial [Solirubrobacteraceae bacterium]|nr:family 1 encapsulin nanocompartment shell protein [Solirubrobacteraceae bacterium]
RERLMSHLLREHAPITQETWALIDDEARERLTPALAARRLVDFSGPHGWQHSATSLGRVRALADTPQPGMLAAQRRVLPIVEMRVPFTLSRSELRDADRGAQDVELGPLDEAARRMAVAENRAVFHGWSAAGIAGIAQASAHEPLALGEDCERYPRHVARAVQTLLDAGVGGPYGLALGSDAYTRVLETSEHGGFPLLEHLREILGGPLVWAPGVDGAVVLSQRGGDFVLEVGQELSIGYDSHDEQSVELYLEESISFRVLEDDAAVALTP